MNSQFFEYDVVKAKKSLGENVPSGTTGAVLMIFDAIPAKYEVEFVDSTGESLAVMTCREDELELVQRGNLSWKN